ncbi:hypothetical protein A2707_05565 [Candidatus Saccharibacteria bacterium RIFCSPHIGHO2_01_FULL_45_15]|nr:MAG: hypothetical protein A2707_05565 [Candidatus Saccharibacteria bacterium RIFCSPHIGHO2_01_FULL_45_15]OGL28914.1 MAG: hypothetical protein A3C39_05780 [Candidatus Saccharibacteria bacterium RIFCSPHIGHO2_02_FULL_46_12]OGL31927.1 MAG: hypothetical protein A3E76_01510 [Candidatus Saccharibacteria bacterium RIFCSPHIGHO2_12_FULL_44_22]
MEREHHPAENRNMDNNAQVFELGRAAMLDENRLAPLMDISVDHETELHLRTTYFFATIQIQLPSNEPPRHPQFEMFLREHAKGRNLFPTIDRQHMLDLQFDIEDAQDNSLQLTTSFAQDLVRFLDLSDDAITDIGIRRFTSDDATRALHGDIPSPQE